MPRRFKAVTARANAGASSNGGAEQNAGATQIAGAEHKLFDSPQADDARLFLPAEAATNVMVMLPRDDAAGARPAPTRGSIDALLVATDAGLIIIGWIDDAFDPLLRISIAASRWRMTLDASRFLRLRRADVEKAIASRAPHLYGFFGVVQFARGGQPGGAIEVELQQASGAATAVRCAADAVSEFELRETALAHLAGASFFGNGAIESALCLDAGVGTQMIALNEAIVKRIVAAPYVRRFGPQRAAPRATIIVCLLGKPEFYFLQSCLFAALPGIEEYEFIYVCNSPEMSESLLREAQSASLIYGLTTTLVLLAGNAGFGAANNAAARIARSSRLVFVNPDVFPRDPQWARTHAMVVADAPRERTRLFGVPLYYDDGSLMHGGMYFEADVGISATPAGYVGRRLYRVEHYGKGAPPESAAFTASRPVPAVTGAFISIDRAWFETLGGFTEQFIFGHYEDADLSLKSIEGGVAPWMHDIRLWHLEGKGSTRHLAHEGGSIVNRWLFSSRWAATIANGLDGPRPVHPLMRSAGAPAVRPPSARQTPLAPVPDAAARNVRRRRDAR